jgi:hypothetical protein
MLWQRFRYLATANLRGKGRLCYSNMHSKEVPKPAQRASRYGEKDVWAIFTPLAVQHNSVNLGQGFPNIPAPEFVKV